MIISHDFGVINRISDKVVVMYAGSAMEYGDVKELWKEPKHPYTIGLFELPSSHWQSERKTGVDPWLSADPREITAGAHLPPDVTKQRKPAEKRPRKPSTESIRLSGACVMYKG